MKRFSLLIMLIIFLSCEKHETELVIVSGKIIALQAEADENHNIIVSEYQFDTTRSNLNFSTDLLIYIELTTNKNEINNHQNIKKINNIGLSWGELYLTNKGFPEGYHDFYYPITSFPTLIDSNLLSLYSSGNESIENIILGGYQIPFPLISLPMDKDIHDSKRLHDIKSAYNNGSLQLIDNKIQLILCMSAHQIGEPAKLNGQLLLNIGYSDKSVTMLDSLSLKKQKIFDSPYGDYYLDMSQFE